jgi:(E)-4-hydroxy-3-methylbut-2-enyl-diphosphate synthase
VSATVAQIGELEALGCDIVRLAVPDERAARALTQIRGRVRMPLVADIHFNHRLALMALDAGVDGLRINPGNIGGIRKIREIVRAASGRKVAIRVGVNSGSLEKDLLSKYGGPVPEALVESAVRNVRLLEDCGFREIKISVKASDARRTIAAYRLLSKRTNYPLHLGVTEAGTFLAGTVSSSAALAILLAEGIGDTIRVSLTDTPQQEVRVGLALLRSLGLRPPGPSVISCPTCGRTQIAVARLANDIEAELEAHFRRHPGAPCPLVAVMGCIVNGPGEARHADIAVAGGRGRAALYVRGKHIKTVKEKDIVKAILAQVAAWRPAPGIDE